MIHHQQAPRQEEVRFVGKFFMNFPSKSRLAINQDISKRTVTSNKSKSLNRKKTATTVDNTSVGSSRARPSTYSNNSTRTSIELLSPPIYSSTDSRIISRESIAGDSSFREQSDSSITKESCSRPFLSAEVIADSLSPNVIENSK
jgi:hypothetical protein